MKKPYAVYNSMRDIAILNDVVGTQFPPSPTLIDRTWNAAPAMDAFPDLVWQILLERGAEVQMKYSTWSSDAMPKPKRRCLLDEKAWTDLLDAVQEAMKVGGIKMEQMGLNEFVFRSL